MEATVQTQDTTQIAQDTADEATEGLPKRPLTDKEMEKLADVCLEFSVMVTGIELYPYQREFGWRICYSLLIEDAEEITALFSRQSGKTETVACVVVGMGVMLPILAKNLPHDPRLSKFKNGLWCGIFAPNYELAGIMWSRMKARMYSVDTKRALLDPDIDMDLTNRPENMVLPNGTFVDCGTASPQAVIEGKTYHLILLEETQDISSAKIRSSIHPMGAATAASLVKIGTCNRNKNEFYEACRRNKRADTNKGLVRSRFRTHFEFDYTVAQRYNARYRKYIEKEIARLGYDSDDFKMKYRLIWMLERGMFVNPDLFDECGIKESGNSLSVSRGRGRHAKKLSFTRPPNVVPYDSATPKIIAAVDVGRDNSTVVTVAKVFWDGPVDYADTERYPMHIYNWLELQGDDHEEQYPQITSFLKNYRISDAIVDATGKGDPVYSRLAADLEEYGIHVHPFTFTAQSKDIGYKVFLQEISAGRFTFPAGSRASRLQKWQRFVNQMYDLEKNWRGSTLVVNKPKDDTDARDDFPDSAMMACWLVNVRGSMDIEEQSNPFFSRGARWAATEMVKDARAWYRNLTDPRNSTRPSKRGKFD